MIDGFYHVTFADRLDEVYARGLLPRSEHTGATVWDDVPVVERAVYLFTRREKAEDYCRRVRAEKTGREMVVIEVDGRSLSPRSLIVDPEDIGDVVYMLDAFSRDSNEFLVSTFGQDGADELAAMHELMLTYGRDKHWKSDWEQVRHGVIEHWSMLSRATHEALLDMLRNAEYPKTEWRWARVMHTGPIPPSALLGQLEVAAAA